MLLDYLVTSHARKDLLQVLWRDAGSGTVRELARLAHVAPSAADKELNEMEKLGLVKVERLGNAKVARANTSSPYAKVLRQLLSARPSPRQSREADHAAVRSWLAHYGAPVSGGPAGTVPALEHVLVRALRLSHHDASLTRVLPAVLWQNRLRLHLDLLTHEACRADQGRTLGFLLELTDVLSGQAFFGAVVEVLRDKRHRREVYFFSADQDSELARELAQARTPEVGRRWKFLMNMPLDSFEAAFRKVISIDGDVQLGATDAIREGARSGTPRPSTARGHRRRRGSAAIRRHT